MKGQGKIVVGFRVERLQAHRLGKFRLRRADVARPQTHQPKIVVSLRKIRIATHKLFENIGCATRVVALAEYQTQLDACIRVLGIETDRFLQLPSGFVQSPGLRQREAEVVMPLRRVRIGHDRLAELLEPTSLITLPPVEQPQACVGCA